MASKKHVTADVEFGTRMSSRSKKIMALLPPSTSDMDSSSDDDMEKELYDGENNCSNSDYDSSEAPSLPPDVAAVFDELSNTDTASENDFPVSNQFSERIPIMETPKSVFTPIKTRSKLRNEQTPQTSYSAIECEEKKLNVLEGASAPAKKNKINKRKNGLKYQWNTNKFEFLVEIPYNNFSIPEKLKSPIEYFLIFFSPDLFHLIVENTNLYAVQQTGKSVNVIEQDIRDFISILIIMGIVDLPAYTDYWSQKLRYPEIADTMSLKRFQQIRKSLHFANNSNINDDPYFRIRPVLEIIRRNCHNIEEEIRQSVDEMMVPYKGKKAGFRRQYIKSKPKKWGFKIFVRAGITGFVYDFIVYGGDKTLENYKFSAQEEQLGMGGKVVVALSKSMKKPALSVLYFDNYFTSFDLIYFLRYEYGILSLGTIRQNRLQNCILESDKDLKKKGRGSFCCRTDNTHKLSCVKWYDNKAVTLLSSYMSSEPISTIKRYDKVQKKKSDIVCPNVVKHYNSHMGGVDTMDMLVSLYRIPLKTRRWYLSIFAQMLDIALNNAWLLYRRDRALLHEEGNQLALKDFRYEIAQVLKMKDRHSKKRGYLQDSKENKKIKRPVVFRPANEIRYDKVDHFPTFGSKGRCRYCKQGETHWTCSKCNLRLCLVKDRNCFYQFHHNV